MSTPNGLMVGTRAAERGRRRGTLWPTLRAIYIIWYRDVLRYWRDRTRLLTSLVQPLLFLIVFGTGLSSALSGAGGGFAGPAAAAAGLTYTQFIFPGIIGMSVLFSAIFGAMSIVWDREFGFLKEVLVAPIDRSAVAIGKSVGGATQACETLARVSGVRVGDRRLAAKHQQA